MFYQFGPIEHGKHVTGPVSQSSSESEYNAACTVGMALANFRMLIHEFLKNYRDIVPEEALLVIFIVSLLCVWIRMVMIPNTQGTFQGEFIL